ncbi:hypothetical protein BGX26_008173 [Mortierella sp. AD094]|nr:hypothetical protein BGX26_008173 [Mortierella sp. AD094]
MVPQTLATAADFSALTSSLNAFYTNRAARAKPTPSITHSTDTNDTVDTTICEIEEQALPRAVIPDRCKPALESPSHTLTDSTTDDDHPVNHPLSDPWQQRSFPDPTRPQEEPKEWKSRACSQPSNRGHVILAADDMQIHSRRYKEEPISSAISPTSDQAEKGPCSRHLCTTFGKFIARPDPKDIQRKKDHDHPILIDISCDEKAPDETVYLHLAAEATRRQASESAISCTLKVDSASDLACSKWANRAAKPKIDSVGAYIVTPPSRLLESRSIVSLSGSKWSQPSRQQESGDVRGTSLGEIEVGDKVKSKVNMISLTNTSTTSRLTVAEKLVLIQQGRGIARLGDSFMPLKIRDKGSINNFSAAVEYEYGRCSGRMSEKCANDKRKIRYSREFLMSFKHLTTPPRCIESIMAAIHGGARKPLVGDATRMSTLAADIRTEGSDQALYGEPGDAPSGNIHRSSNTSSGGLGQVRLAELSLAMTGALGEWSRLQLQDQRSQRATLEELFWIAFGVSF